jgi:hypothetical protein
MPSHALSGAGTSPLLDLPHAGALEGDRVDGMRVTVR